MEPTRSLVLWVAKYSFKEPPQNESHGCSTGTACDGKRELLRHWTN